MAYNPATIKTDAYAALGFTDHERLAADALLGRLDLRSDDPMGIPFIGMVKTQAMIDKMEAALSSMTADQKAEHEILLRKMRGTIAGEMERQLKAIPANVSDKLDEGRDAFFKKLRADLVDENRIMMQAARKSADTFRLSSLAFGLVLFGVVAFGLGNINGLSAGRAENSAWDTLRTRSDFANLTRFAVANDWNRIGADCGLVGTNQQRGVAECGGSVTLYKDRPLPDSVGSNGLRLIWAEYTAKLGTVGTLGVTLLAGLGLGWLLWGRKKPV